MTVSEDEEFYILKSRDCMVGIHFVISTITIIIFGYNYN